MDFRKISVNYSGAISRCVSAANLVGDVFGAGMLCKEESDGREV